MEETSTTEDKPKYVQWILDSFPQEILSKKRLHTFEINFLAEAQAGEHLFILTEKVNEEYFSEIKRADALKV